MPNTPPYAMEDLSDEWFDCDTHRFEDELRREMAPDHDLAGEDLVCVAWRRHMKETVFWLPQRQRWAVIHLTWNVESDPRWPEPVLCETWSEVIAELRDRGRP